MNVENVMNVATLIVIVAVFFLKAVAFLSPLRGLTLLRLTLAVVDLAIVVVFGVTLLGVEHVLTPPLPPWYLWGIRLVLIVSGIAAVIELIRAGALRRSRQNDRHDREEVL